MQKNRFIDPAIIYPPDFIEWISLSMQERWIRTAERWDMYIAYGGDFNPDPDPQSPFFDPKAQGPGTPDGRSGVRLIRRC